MPETATRRLPSRELCEAVDWARPELTGLRARMNRWVRGTGQHRRQTPHMHPRLRDAPAGYATPAAWPQEIHKRCTMPFCGGDHPDDAARCCTVARKRCR
jgi:hypothetical protein